MRHRRVTAQCLLLALGHIGARFETAVTQEVDRFLVEAQKRRVETQSLKAYERRKSSGAFVQPFSICAYERLGNAMLLGDFGLESIQAAP
jgi:hypothetical protein